MPDDLNVPIALRRTRRGNGEPSRPSSPSAMKVDPVIPSCLSSISATPRTRGRPKKRVRFSDPGPSLATLSSSPSSGATGLTPMIRRTSIARALPKQRRLSTPLPKVSGKSLDLDLPSSPLTTEMNFLPLRQVLDGRVKRRIRRNRLSEEMNAIHNEKKRRAEETKAEIEGLKAEVSAKDEEIQRLQEHQQDDDTVLQDTGRIIELERQVDELRRQLASHSGVDLTARGDEQTYNWTMAARGPYADEYTAMDLDSDPMDADNEDQFGESTMAELQCGTPTRRSRNRGSFPTPPSTSPATMLMTPSSRFSTPRSHAGVQVEMGDVEKQQLEEELASLQLEICKLTGSLESYQGLVTRLSDQLGSFPPSEPATPSSGAASSANPHRDLETHLAHLLQTLSDRTAAILHLSSSLSELGFPGSDASEIITSLSAAFRTARLELEYLTPGEIALPLTSAGAQVLDLLLTRLRDLARKGKEADEQVDEYHELELTLRQQLGARVEAMDGLVREVARLEAQAKGKGERVSELEVGVERLKGAVASYARDVGELEKLVERIEGELEGKGAEVRQLLSGQGELGESLKARDETIAQKTSAIAELEGRLSTTMRQTDALHAELTAVQDQTAKARTRHRDGVNALNKAHGQALALRDARVSELRGEIDRVNTALRAAHETIRQLRVDNSGLEARLDDEQSKAKAAIEDVKAELERVVRMSQEFLVATPRKPKAGRRTDSGIGLDDHEGMPAVAVQPGMFLDGALARRNSGGRPSAKKRRRYDSGLGFLDEEEVDLVA